MPIIDNFHPASSFRMDCYRHSLIPIINHFNMMWEIFMLFPLNHFSFDGKLECVEFSDIKINHMLMDVGIKRSFVKVSDEDLIDVICSSIDNKYPVIVYIDSFYNPSFPSIYMKHHSQHCIPIYGYNRENEEFNIIDSDYIDDFTRKECSISFSDLKNCFLSYVKHYNSVSDIQVFSKIQPKCQNTKKKYIGLFKDIVCNNEDPLTKYHEEFGDFCKYFENIYNNQEIMLKLSSSLYMAFNKMINAKHIEYVGYKIILSDYMEIIKIIENLIEKYNYVRAIFFKTHYSKKYRVESFHNCSKVMWDIYSLENEYINSIKRGLVETNFNYIGGIPYGKSF